MYCDRCGAQLQDQQQFCHSCGKSFATPQARAVPRPAAGRVARHVTIVGVLWVVYSLFHLLPSMAAMTIGAVRFPALAHDWGIHGVDAPLALGPMLAVFGGLAGVLSILGIIAGVALLSYQNAARIFIIILAFLSLLNFPFGTLLGAYTLWVLLAGSGEAEFRRLSQTR
jgi:hypothetical protein